MNEAIKPTILFNVKNFAERIRKAGVSLFYLWKKLHFNCKRRW